MNGLIFCKGMNQSIEYYIVILIQTPPWFVVQIPFFRFYYPHNSTWMARHHIETKKFKGAWANIVEIRRVFPVWVKLCARWRRLHWRRSNQLHKQHNECWKTVRNDRYYAQEPVKSDPGNMDQSYFECYPFVQREINPISPPNSHAERKENQANGTRLARSQIGHTYCLKNKINDFPSHLTTT